MYPSKMSFHSQAAEAKERMEMDDEERQGTVCSTLKKGELLWQLKYIYCSCNRMHSV